VKTLLTLAVLLILLVSTNPVTASPPFGEPGSTYSSPNSLTAPPPLPSSFWGYVTGAPAGTVIRAFVPGRTRFAAETTTFAWESYVVYAFNVPGDIAGTQAKEGGVEGDTITFKVSGQVIATAVWHSGTNVHLDLTIVSKKAR
jgi:hypothetical protein